MATPRNKRAGPAQQSEPPVLSVTPEAPGTNGHKLLPGLTPGTLTDDGYYVPMGALSRVRCPIFPGLDLWVLFLPSVRYAYTRDDYWFPDAQSPVENACRKLATYVRGFEGWKFKDVTGQVIPPPDPTDWQTYRPICGVRGELTELYAWLTGTGLTQALVDAGNPT